MQILDLIISDDKTILKHPDAVPSTDALKAPFFYPLWEEIWSLIDPNTRQLPHVNFDNIGPKITAILDNLTDGQINLLLKHGIDGKKISKKSWNKEKERQALMSFLWQYPYFTDLISNISLLSPIIVQAAEAFLNEKITDANFLKAKSHIDTINSQRWTRERTQSESQSGISNLGAISELLLEKVLEEHIDNKNFFKNNNAAVKSYGDFVLTCLPNNLWISVKSNFARERLLASGYTTDIIGVGFFTEMNEFTSQQRIRNFQRVGFIAMYLPDFPISQEQIEQETNTYDQVIQHFNEESQSPLNINGTQFIRPISLLPTDLKKILDVKELPKRTVLKF